MRWLRDYFNINRRQERGLWVLMVLLLISIALFVVSPYMFPSRFEPLSQQLKEQLDSVEWELYEARKTEFQKQKKTKPLKAFAFNPNTVSVKELKSMGLSESVAKQWLSYRDKGGYFSKAEDVKRLYAITDELYKSLAPYMYFDMGAAEASKPSNPSQSRTDNISKVSKDNTNTYVEQKISPKPKTEVFMGVNSADSVSLLQVKGIGPYYAGAIVRYRERLGGYIDLLQLKELYNVDEERYALWEQSLFLDTVELRKLAINTADFKSLLKHPYTDYETTKYIINKRNRLGGFAAIYQINDEKQLPDSIYTKLLPYLSL